MMSLLKIHIHSLPFILHILHAKCNVTVYKIPKMELKSWFKKSKNNGKNQNYNAKFSISFQFCHSCFLVFYFKHCRIENWKFSSYMTFLKFPMKFIPVYDLFLTSFILRLAFSVGKKNNAAEILRCV